MWSTQGSGLFKLNTSRLEMQDYMSVKCRLSQKLVHEFICML
uniref:Uncharacterized protein n=1 Tax=Phlebotomus papatasi TaxID=29031 RepID=A0A1B0DAL0_PHLPP